APRFRVLRLVDELRDMQERLRRNAPAIDAHAAGVDLGIDERGRESQIGGQKRSRVPTGSAANDNELGRDHQPASARRNGCSNAATTRRRNRTPPALSMRRWS